MAQQSASLPAPKQVALPRPTLRRILGRDWKIAFVFIAPVVLLMTVLIAWPFIKALYTSLTIQNMATRTQVFVGFDNYVRLYADPFYRQSVQATVYYTLGSISVKLLLGMCAALLLHSQKRFRNFLTALVLLPWIVPSVVQALTWKSIYDPLFGGLNPILQSLGIIDRSVAWLSEPATAMAAVIAVNVWAGIPFFTVNILAGLASIDTEMYEAAEIDGANVWQQFLHITLPSLRYVIAVATLLSTIWTFNGFETIWLLTNGGPGNLTKVYSIMAYQKAIGALQFGPGTAVAFSLTPILGGFILLLSRYMRRDVSREEMDVVVWQDRVIDAIGWTIGSIGSIIAFPIMLILRGIARLLPQGAKSRKREATISGLLRGIGILLLLMFVIFPFYWILITSFKSELQISQRVGTFWPAPWTTQQYYKLFYEQPFWVWFTNSSIVAVSTTALAVIIAALGAYALARLKFLGAQMMQTLLLITYLIPGSLMFIPLYQILADLGVINTRWALILTYPTSMIPFATWLLMGYYRSIPEDLEHAAMVDGATRLGAFLRVTLPLTMPAILAVTLFSFTAAWKEYLFAFVFISSERLMTLPVGLSTTIYGDIYPWGLLMAASLIISIPVVIFYMWGQRFMVAGLTAGSVKG